MIIYTQDNGSHLTSLITRIIQSSNLSPLELQRNIDIKVFFTEGTLDDLLQHIIEHIRIGKGKPFHHNNHNIITSFFLKQYATFFNLNISEHSNNQLKIINKYLGKYAPTWYYHNLSEHAIANTLHKNDQRRLNDLMYDMRNDLCHDDDDEDEIRRFSKSSIVRDNQLRATVHEAYYAVNRNETDPIRSVVATFECDDLYTIYPERRDCQ